MSEPFFRAAAVVLLAVITILYAEADREVYLLYRMGRKVRALPMRLVCGILILTGLGLVLIAFGPR